MTEATEAFFAMTKLFQSKDVILRRMVYLGIKELSGIAEDVIIVTSSLTKDMTGKEDLYRAAAIRALCSITDITMLQAIERYMKQAIVDRNSAVSSAALVSSLHLTKVSSFNCKFKFLFILKYYCECFICLGCWGCCEKMGK